MPLKKEEQELQGVKRPLERGYQSRPRSYVLDSLQKSESESLMPLAALNHPIAEGDNYGTAIEHRHTRGSRSG